MNLLIVICVCLVAFLYFGIPLSYSRWSRSILKIRTVKQNALVLTFDDGPGEHLTSTILSILTKYNAKATFFLSGSKIPGREAIVRKIADSGHDVCSHGYDHLNYWKISPIRSIADIRRGWQSIDIALGANNRTYPFRPPYGKLNLICLLYLWLKKVPVIYWTIDSGDRTMLNKPDNQRLASLVKNSKGGVTLAHDSDRRVKSTETLTLESIEATLKMARESGLQVLTVSELLEKS